MIPSVSCYLLLSMTTHSELEARMQIGSDVTELPARSPSRRHTTHVSDQPRPRRNPKVSGVVRGNNACVLCSRVHVHCHTFTSSRLSDGPNRKTIRRTKHGANRTHLHSVLPCCPRFAGAARARPVNHTVGGGACQ